MHHHHTVASQMFEMLRNFPAASPAEKFLVVAVMVAAVAVMAAVMAAVSLRLMPSKDLTACVGAATDLLCTLGC